MDKLFKAMADRNRRKILTLLKDQEMSVYEILKYFEITQATLSNHLSILRKANLVKCTIKGKQRIYRLNKDVLVAFADNINRFAGTIGTPVIDEIGVRRNTR